MKRNETQVPNKTSATKKFTNQGKNIYPPVETQCEKQCQTYSNLPAGANNQQNKRIRKRQERY
jgi:hypothetical protein